MKPIPKAVLLYGGDILSSEGMMLSKTFMQHGSTSVYVHSVAVVIMCLRIAAFFHIRCDVRALVRGALLHDYFLYDWHVKDSSHRLHGFHHAHTALVNARRDFEIGAIEANMIESHMFPLGIVLPKYRESVILCIADKLCTIAEVLNQNETDRQNVCSNK